MGFFDFLKQNDFSDLEKQGGMQNKYQKLIKNIENLSKEDFLSLNTFERVELNHKMVSNIIKQNEYVITLIFKREGQISINKDTFKLIHKNDTISIEYSRESNSLLPGILPPIVKLKLNFDNSLSQDLIFIKLLSSIEMKFNKDYNFTDTYFKDTIGLLNGK